MFFVKYNQVPAKESIPRCKGLHTDQEHFRSGGAKARRPVRLAAFGAGLVEMLAPASVPAPRGNPHLTRRQTSFADSQDAGRG